MRRLFLAVIVATTLPSMAFAMSCTERRGICVKYCSGYFKSQNGVAGCTESCQKGHAQCLQTGCFQVGFGQQTCNLVKN